MGETSEAALKRARELVTADIFLEHETKYTQRWDHIEEHDDCYVWECSCGAIEETKFHSWEECHRHTREHWAGVIAQRFGAALDAWAQEARLDGLTIALGIVEDEETSWSNEANRAHFDYSDDATANACLEQRQVAVNIALAIRERIAALKQRTGRQP